MHRLLETLCKVRELPVHFHAYRLEGLASGMATTAARGSWDGGLDDLDELPRRLDRSRLHDPSRDSLGELLVAVLGYEMSERAFVVGVDHNFRGEFLTAVHPHVEGSIGPVGKPALGLIQLRTTDPEIEQDSHDIPFKTLRSDHHFFHDAFELFEAAVHYKGSITELP